MIQYGTGIPTGNITKSWYLDLQTDTLYQRVKDGWLAVVSRGTRLIPPKLITV